MPSSLLLLFLKGIFVQGWVALLYRRHSRRAWALALFALDLIWLLWAVVRLRGGAHLTWRQTGFVLWVAPHLLLGAMAAVETLARLSPWPRVIRGIGLGVGLLALGGVTWGLAEAYGPPERVEVSLAFPDLPSAFDGYRILLVSDFHAGPYAGSRTLGRWARAMGDMDADLVVGAGDFISYWPQETDLLRQPFAGLHPRDGMVGVLGNHDRYRTFSEVETRLEGLGWRILTEDTLTLQRGQDRMLLMGLAHPDEDLDDFRPEWRHAPSGPGFRIGIAHSPELWPQLRAAGARLSLAGHTHGGQINLDPFYNVARAHTGYVAGLYAEGPDRLFVTRGLGCTALPFRFRCRPELVRITLHRG